MPEAGTEEARERIARFTHQFKQVRAARSLAPMTLSVSEIETRLRDKGFTRRTLKPFQRRNVQRLVALSNGTNFSVPSAGKTTVTLALDMLASGPEQHVLVVGPKASFPAWREVVDECMTADAPDGGAEPFEVVVEPSDKTRETLLGGGRRFVINYDLLIQAPSVITEYLATHHVHLVLDESHRR